MSSHRKPKLTAARKRTRAITLCAATFGAAAMPALAQAATSGSTSVNAVTASASGTTARQHLLAVAAYATNLKKSVEAVSDSTSSSTGSTGSSSADTTYTVVSGDTLSALAERVLGNGDDYPELFKLNENRAEPDGRTFTDPNLIVTGWTLELPTSSSSSATTSSSSSSNSSSSDSSSSDSSSGSTSTASNSSDSSSSSSSSSSSASTASSSSSSSTTYADNLDGWINQAISILSANGYSVTYNAIYQTAMNESSGNPDAQNNTDSNAAAGNPSEGLMQTTPTTFAAYALSGYNDIWNPVDNIIAAVIYAQDTYGGLDNVVSARCDGSCWYGY
jgi:LysM repeat protein